MSNSSLAFAFDEPSPPVVAMAAQTMASELAAGRTLSRSDINRIMTEHFGGSDALGRWSVRDAHAAIELAQVQYLQASEPIRLSARIEEADRFFCSLEARISTQTNRSEEQIEWQQFATPPRLAWLAARACALVADEVVLEPSAGTGMLAVWASKAGTRLALNEISPLRRDYLSALFPAARTTGYDAELIDELLDPAISPSVVLMNPPYSHGIERGTIVAPGRGICARPGTDWRPAGGLSRSCRIGSIAQGFWPVWRGQWCCGSTPRSNVPSSKTAPGSLRGCWFSIR